MTKEYRITWAALVILAIASYSMSGRSDEELFVAMLSATTVVKMSLVVLVFMEMKKAHPAWLLILGGIMLLFATLMLLFSA